MKQMFHIFLIKYKKKLCIICMNVIINIFFLYFMCERDVDKLFSSDARIVSSGGYYGGFFTGTSVNPISKYIGESYKKILRITKHYVSYYSKASPEFYSWYLSDSFELDEAKKRIILNVFNDNVHSMEDLSAFWQSTMGPLLEGDLQNLKNILIKLEETIRSYEKEGNFAAEDPFRWSTSDETLLKTYHEQADIIYGLLTAGCTNYKKKNYNNVHEWFIMAAGARKKFNREFGNLFPVIN